MAPILTGVDARWQNDPEQLLVGTTGKRQIQTNPSVILRIVAEKIGWTMHASKEETHRSRRRRRGRRRQPLWSNGRSTAMTMLVHLLMLFCFLRDPLAGTVTGFSMLPGKAFVLEAPTFSPGICLPIMS
uniref:Uncharacterized protein n=1 Tax=Anopheles culicifacies TaxID=139723 RepID=A0A182LWM9_9DIPT